MSRFLPAASTALAIAIAVASAPAQAQLIGGGLGGGVTLPGGSIGSMGDIGVSRIPGGVETISNGSVTATRTHRTPHVPRTAVKGSVTSAVTAAVPDAAGSARVIHVPALPATTLATGAVVLPAIPDVAVRRAAIIEAGIAPVPVYQVPAYVDRQYVVLQDDLRGTGVVVHKRGDQIVLDLPSDVNFAFDKYDIQPRFYRVLDVVSRTLSHYRSTYVDVNGHTDAIGSYSYNQGLSEKRADTVADYLGARGVNPARMHVEGFGKTEPIASNATVAGRAANRRVEIILTPYAS